MKTTGRDRRVTGRSTLPSKELTIVMSVDIVIPAKDKRDWTWPEGYVLYILSRQFVDLVRGRRNICINASNRVDALTNRVARSKPQG